MGLDMYLTGERILHGGHERRRGEMKGELFELGYWRKHPNLHGYIVETFADDDDCKPVYLSGEDLAEIIKAIESDQLPHTDGFFFGSSDGSEKPEDLLTFRETVAWLEAEDNEAWRFVYYQASW